MSSRRALTGWSRLSEPYICRSCRLDGLYGPPRSSTIQQRYLSINHAKRIIEAEKDWQQRAVAIKEGRKRNFFHILEERGLINQIVGYVNSLGIVIGSL